FAGAEIIDANLRGAHLVDADLRGAAFSGSSLHEIDLSLAVTSRALKSDSGELGRQLDAHARWIASGGHDGKRADFQDCDLTGLDLGGANLAAAQFGRAVLAGAKLSGAILLATDL